MTRNRGEATRWFRGPSPAAAHRLAYVLGGLLLFVLWPGEILACVVRVENPAVVFPVEKMERGALCRVAAVVNNYTTYRIVPPQVTRIQKSVYTFLLDHPVLTTVLVRNLALAKYRVTRIGADSFQGDDGQGAEGLITLLFQDTTRRVYHVQGSHRVRPFPLITGEAIVMLNYHSMAVNDGREYVETRITTYSKLDNRVMATVVRALQPILRRVVNEKLTHAFLAVHQLGELMAVDPKQVYRQAENSTELDRAEREALQALLLRKDRPAPDG
jgi:hypothetical protein